MLVPDRKRRNSRGGQCSSTPTSPRAPGTCGKAGTEGRELEGTEDQSRESLLPSVMRQVVNLALFIPGLHAAANRGGAVQVQSPRLRDTAVGAVMTVESTTRHSRW